LDRFPRFSSPSHMHRREFDYGLHHYDGGYLFSRVFFRICSRSLLHRLWISDQIRLADFSYDLITSSISSYGLVLGTAPFGSTCKAERILGFHSLISFIPRLSSISSLDGSLFAWRIEHCMEYAYRYTNTTRDPIRHGLGTLNSWICRWRAVAQMGT
jgi:fatty-acid desaturase